MDEVQLVGHSGAADTVSMIERTSSIAVSGTPIKRGDLTDLQSLFRFLRVPFAPSGAQWQRLLGPSMAHSLARVLRVLATRHIKDDIKGEMVLPTQTRWLVPIELGPVQRAYYEDLWNAALRDLGLSERGEPTNDMYEPDVSISHLLSHLGILLTRFIAQIEKLRRHLLLLRRCCTHPQVAQAAAPAGGGGRGGQQTSIGRTIQDMKTVLERMIEGAASTRDSLFLSVRSKAINAATLLLQDKLDPSPTRLEEVRTLLEKEQAALEGKIEELRKALRAARTEGPAYRFSEEELEEMNDSDEESDFESDAGAATDAASKKLKERVKLRANHVTALKLRLRLVSAARRRRRGDGLADVPSCHSSTSSFIVRCTHSDPYSTSSESATCSAPRRLRLRRRPLLVPRGIAQTQWLWMHQLQLPTSQPQLPNQHLHLQAQHPRSPSRRTRPKKTQRTQRPKRSVANCSRRDSPRRRVPRRL